MKAGEGAASAAGTGGWKQAAAQLGAAGPGRELDEACRRAVDELERAAGHGAGARGLEEATRELSGLLDDLDYDTCAKVLGASIGRVYTTPENCGALGALFGEIGKGDDAHRRTRLALEGVRVALMCAYARADGPGDSARTVLNLCYDALAGVARDNGLRELSRIMGEEGARAAACSGRGSMGDMARLWGFIDDMHDAPSCAEINDTMGRCGRIRAMVSKKETRLGRARISRFVQRIALDRAMREDYQVIYTVAAESNIRIRYWIDEIYAQHGVHNDPFLLDSLPRSVFQKRSMRWANLAVAVKYLALELGSFRKWERYAYRKIVKRLNTENPDALYKILEGRKEAEGPVMRLRNSFGAHIDWTFNEVKAEVDRVGLASIMCHARRVLLFQDAAYRKIPHKYHARDPWAHEAAKGVTLLGEPDRLEKITEKYREADIELSAKYVNTWHAIHESSLGLCMVHAKYLERLHQYDESADGFILLNLEMYNVKYMFLELCNITEKLKGIALDAPFDPGFFSREKEYCRLRNYYAAHPRPRKIQNIMQVLEEERELLSQIPYDIGEVEQVVQKLEKKFSEMRTYEITHMTKREMDDIELDIVRTKERSHADLGNAFWDPDEEQGRREAKEILKEKFGLSGRPKGEARSVPGASGEAGSGSLATESPLCEAEDAVGGFGAAKCPRGWVADLVCGDYGGALARMGAHSALSAAGAAVEVPERPGGAAGGPDMAAGEGEGRCWISVCALDNVPRMLGADGHVEGAGRAVAADILAAARERLADARACPGQAALAVMDPGGAIADHGGLEEALVGIGREMPWVGAVAVVRAGRCEVRDVPHSENPLRDGVREMLRGLGPAGGKR